jgi:hypothetical protein
MVTIISVQMENKAYLQILNEDGMRYIRVFESVDEAIAHIEGNSVLLASDFAIHEIDEDDEGFFLKMGIFEGRFSPEWISNARGTIEVFYCDGKNALSWHKSGIKVDLNQGVEV